MALNYGRRRAKLSQVGRTPEGIRCPKCGGSQFEGARDGGQKTMAVIFLPAMLFQKKRNVRCVVCRTTFRRG